MLAAASVAQQAVCRLLQRCKPVLPQLPEGLEQVEDSTIAILGALLLFVIPVNLKKREFLLDWQTAVKIPWDIIVLFGGGFALAQGFSESGLTSWLAAQLAVLKGVNLALLIMAVVLLVIYLTELTSNTATACCRRSRQISATEPSVS